jgi:CheY-like chemotaxis protein
VFEAGSADGAIAVLEAHSKIRVVVTDIHMPGTMDGLKLSHYVGDRWSPIALIGVSGEPEISIPGCRHGRCFAASR